MPSSAGKWWTSVAFQKFYSSIDPALKDGMPAGLRDLAWTFYFGWTSPQSLHFVCSHAMTKEYSGIFDRLLLAMKHIDQMLHLIFSNLNYTRTLTSHYQTYSEVVKSHTTLWPSLLKWIIMLFGYYEVKNFTFISQGDILVFSDQDSFFYG